MATPKQDQSSHAARLMRMLCELALDSLRSTCERESYEVIVRLQYDAEG